MGLFHLYGVVRDKHTRTAAEFQEDTRPRLFGFSENVVTLAELFFVEGQSSKEAGEQCGMPKQSVGQALSRVLAALNQHPKDWVYYEGYMPPALAKETRQNVDALLSGTHSKNRSCERLFPSFNDQTRKLSWVE